MISVYDYKDYKQLIKNWIESHSQQTRGLRKSLAAALGCQTPFITHVLTGNYHFSLEQAEACTRWMGLNDRDSEFFMLLVMRQRASTKHLEKMLDRQIHEKLEQDSGLKKRLKITEGLTPEKQQIYYSSWHYSALHMAVMIPHLQSVEALQKHFQLPLSRVVQIVEFLVELGLVDRQKNQLKIKRPVIHLEKESPLLVQHHLHWRMRAIEAIQLKSVDDVHYSGVMSLSKDDFDWVRARLTHLLQEIVEKIKDSKDEKLATLNFDWFSL